MPQSALSPNGLPRDEVLAQLAEMRRRERDLDWRSGKVLAYTFDAGPELEEVVKSAYSMYLTENLLDPTAFPSLRRMEGEVVRAVADLLRGDEAVVGNYTAGGTESILLAVKTARDWARANRPEIRSPKMILPRTAHCAFHKAAWYLGVEAVFAPFDPRTFRADVAAIERLIDADTILLVGSAPEFAFGVVDPIAEIAALAKDRGILCHVDGCMGGLMLSVMRRAGRSDLPDFDFSVPGVTSISVDLHKYGYAAKGASTVLYRNKDLRRHQIFASAKATSYALVNNGVLSSRSGGPVAAAWAAMKFLGEEGYRAIHEEVVEATRRAIAATDAIPELRVLGRPDMCLFAFASDALNVFQVADAMHRRGWHLQPQFSTEGSPSNVHVTMDLAAARIVDRFAEDLRGAVEEVRREPKIDPAVVRAQVAKLLAAAGDAGIAQLAASGGLSGTALPENMAMVNTIMDAMPDEIVERLLGDFMNDLFA